MWIVARALYDLGLDETPPFIRSHKSGVVGFLKCMLGNMLAHRVPALQKLELLYDLPISPSGFYMLQIHPSYGEVEGYMQRLGCDGPPSRGCG